MTCIGGVPLDATINLLTIIFKVIFQFNSVETSWPDAHGRVSLFGEQYLGEQIAFLSYDELTTSRRNRQDLLEVLDLAARGKVKAHCEIRDINDLNRYVNVIPVENRGE